MSSRGCLTSGPEYGEGGYPGATYGAELHDLACEGLGDVVPPHTRNVVACETSVVVVIVVKIVPCVASDNIEAPLSPKLYDFEVKNKVTRSPNRFLYLFLQNLLKWVKNVYQSPTLECLVSIVHEGLDKFHELCSLNLLFKIYIEQSSRTTLT